MSNSSTLTPQSTRSPLFPIIASVNLSALAHNLAEIRRCLPPTCELLAVVKADAYGHGAVTVSQTLAQLGIRRFGVATVQEGVALRMNGISQPILVMGGLLPSHLSDLIHYSLTPVISNEETGYKLSELLSQHPSPYPIHVKVDTGMKRLGLNLESVLPFLKSAALQNRLHVEGLMTHLADADNPDPIDTRKQLDRFQIVLNQLDGEDMTIPLLHTANSAGILYHPSSHFNMVRPGIMLYGYRPGTNAEETVKLQPLMKVSTYVVQTRSVTPGDAVGYNGSYQVTKPARIAVLPVGYAHGYPRLLSNKGMVLIQGHRVPIVGKICMDMMLVDTTGLPEVQPGDEVVLMGEQGTESISAEDIAGWVGTIPYEIICNLGSKVNHVYEPLITSEENHL